MTQINFNNHRDKLTQEDKDQIVELLGKGLRMKNYSLLVKRVNEHLNLIPHNGILERVIKEPQGWSYCAGQSYPDEIRTVRNIILKC